MKKIMIFLISIILLSLTSCQIDNTNNSVSDLDYVLNNGGVFYSFKTEMKYFTDAKEIDNIDEVNDNDNYNIIIFDCTKVYDDISSNTVNKLFDELSSETKTLVLFIEAPNLNFFEDTEFSIFANNENEYSSDSYASGIYNFGGNQGLTRITYDLDTDASNKISKCIIDISYMKIKRYIGNQ